MNLLFSMADQFRFDALSSVTPTLHTPNLDALALDGVQFLRAYSSTPTCTPARAALLTGRSPWGHGMLGYGAIAQQYPFEYPRTLASAGYTLGVVGKDHFGYSNLTGALRHAFNEINVYDGMKAEPDNYTTWFRSQHGTAPESCFPTLDHNSWRGAANVCDEDLLPSPWIGRHAVEFLERHKDAGLRGAPPFLLKVSFVRPHSPYDPPDRLLNLTHASEMPTPARSTDGWSERFRDPSNCIPMGSNTTADNWCGSMPPDEELLARRAYNANVRFVDEQIGAIHDALARTGLLRRTLWLFVSDHGDAQGDHYHWRKGFPYEFSAHVPLILRWPEDAWPASLPSPQVARGSKLDSLVELRDIAPSLLQAADALPPDASTLMDGFSLLCLLVDPSGHASEAALQAGCPSSWRQMLDLEHDLCYNASNHWSALTDGSLKFIFHAQYGEEQLFNLTADPKETTDLAARPSHAHKVSQFRAAMVAQFEREERGPAWVLNGALVPRPKSQKYGPNYPSAQRTAFLE